MRGRLVFYFWLLKLDSFPYLLKDACFMFHTVSAFHLYCTAVFVVLCASMLQAVGAGRRAMCQDRYNG